MTRVASPIGLGLARLTIASSGRRIDLALPENVPLAELIPTLLHHLGESMRDGPDSDATGWNIRRANGAILAYDRSLSAQQVRDGEVLHLSPRDKDWPEPEYDDLVMAVADGGRQFGKPWHGGLTRTAALLGSAGGLLAGLAVLLSTGPSWQWSAITALIISAAAMLCGTVMSRAASDSGAGGLVAVVGVPYAFVGGLLIIAGDAQFGELDAEHVLTGSALMLMVSVIGIYAVADRLWLFVGGAVLSLYGVLASLLMFTSISGTGAAALIISAALLLLPFSAVLSIRMAGMPMPDLPRTAQELMAERPMPARDMITAAVVRADEMFAGLLLGVALTATAAETILLRGDISSQVLGAVVAALLIVRTRSLIRPRHRMPLLVSGTIGLVIVGAGIIVSQSADVRPFIVLLGLLPVTLAIAAAGVRYSRRRPTPQLGRMADLVEFLLTVSVVPIVFLVLGLFSFVRGLAG